MSRILLQAAIIALISLPTGLAAAAIQSSAPAQAPAAVPDDLAAYIREVAAQIRANRQQAQRSINTMAAAIASRSLTGENLLYAGIILARARRYEAAIERLNLYLSGSPANRELALAAIIEAASWLDKSYDVARQAYAAYAREFASSTTRDPLREGVLLRMGIEESMARVALLDGDDNKAAAEHYRRALAAAKASTPGSVPLEDIFRLRWWYADAIAADGRLDEALAYLLETRPMVKDDPRIALQLEDRILFKQTDKMMSERRYAEARAMVEKRLREFAPDPILHRRVSKLLDRLKLVDSAAPELAAGRWIGGGPLSIAGLRGKVVLLEFFTSG